MLILSDIYIKYGDRVLLNNIGFTIGMRERIGLVGRNGAGKSTILKVIAGDMTSDSGKIQKPSESTIGYLHQDIQISKGKTLINEARSAFDKLAEIEEKLHKIALQMEQRTDHESDSYHNLIDKYAELNDQFLALGGNETEAEIEKILKGLGFTADDFLKPTETFSGGWQMRIELAKMLLQQPAFLLLDEPTNHLDIESIIWLEEFLQNYSGTVVLISHDQQFLDNVTKRTVEIELGKIYEYKVAYSKYLIERIDRKEKQVAAFANQQKVIEEKQKTINKFIAKATKTKMAQSMQKQLEKMDKIELDAEDLSKMKIRFPSAGRSGETVLEARAVSKSYGEKVVLKDVDFQLHRGERVSFVGQNGQGKTTFAEILIDLRKEDHGTAKAGHNVQIGYYAQNQSETLDRKLTLLETMEHHSPAEMRTQLRKILGAFLFSGEDVDKKVSVLSGGERARLALACMLLSPFNLLVLDEPTNHLDMISKDVLKRALLDYDGSLVIVSHDREFLKGLTEKTIEFRDHQLFTHLGDIEYFLEKRKLRNMREVETRSANGSKGVSNTNTAQKGNYESRKKLQRKIDAAERRIQKIEEQKKEMEAHMGSANFFMEPNSAALIKKHQELERELEKQMEDWERLIETSVE